MTTDRKPKQAREKLILPNILRVALTLFAALLLTSPLSGCLLIGGSSRGGFFIFPGGLGLIVLIAVVALLLRRR